jgi:molybdopterin biosynthesis enzyme
MIQTQRLAAALTPLDTALGLLLGGVTPVAAIEVAVADALGCVAAEMLPLKKGVPDFSLATADGWALRARDIVGASSYSPLQLPKTPPWVEAGERMPDGCDCVLDADLAEQAGAHFQVLAEAPPGHGVRRAGNDLEAGRSIVAAGHRVGAADLLVMRAAGLERVQVRSPRAHVIDVPSVDGNTASSQFICEFLKTNGARVSLTRAAGRDAASLAAAIGAEPCDLLAIVGGTGFGRMDATIHALASRDALLAHGLALQPGRTAAIGKIGATPIVAVPGAPDQALAACLMLIQPALDRLSARVLRAGITRPLARKIASAIGVAELVLLKSSDGQWMPLATGYLSLNAIADADAWFAVPADSEGYAAATALEAFMLRESL